MCSRHASFYAKFRSRVSSGIAIKGHRGHVPQPLRPSRGSRRNPRKKLAGGGGGLVGPNIASCTTKRAKIVANRYALCSQAVASPAMGHCWHVLPRLPTISFVVNLTANYPSCQDPPCLCPLSWLAEMCLSSHLSTSTHLSAK